jgi:DUF1680 family protein
MSKISRRSFGSAAAGALAAARLAAQGRKKAPITAVSVPGDPIAPEVSEGTQPAIEPFLNIGEFTRRDVPLRVAAFSLTDVKLLPSEFLQAQQVTQQYLHDLPVDRLLHNFRLNAGLASNAEPLGGWEKPDCELRGHFVGHYLSACALMVSSTSDQALKEKADQLVAGLAECQQKLDGGYLSAFPIELFDRLRERTKVWAPFYTIHKIMAGLVDMHQLCGSQQALTVVKGMAAWTDRWTQPLSEQQMQTVLDTEYGGMNDVLYLLADITGEAHYAVVGDRFTKKRFFNPLATRRDELRGLHVNTHIPQVIGAARRYQMTGDRRFREVSDYFYTEVTTARAYVTGGTSNNEGWLTGPNQLAKELEQATDTTECCCAYNMLKLSRMLYQWSADPRYVDYFERTLYNHRLGTVEKNGAMQYYLGIVPGEWRTFSTKYDSFWCCDGTGVEEYSKLADSIYFHDDDGVYVNLFIPSRLNWADKGFRLQQTTTFPDEPRTSIRVETAGPMTLHLRIPAWVSGPASVKINGQALEAIASPGSYLSLQRTWQPDDRIELELPMALRLEAMPDDESLRAILFGPLVLAGSLGDAGIKEDLVIGPAGAELKKHPGPKIPEFAVGTRPPAEWLRAADKPLTFVTQGQAIQGQTGPVTFAPLHRTTGQRYSIYWRMVIGA